jgi:WD40 repeat protein
MKRVLLLVTGLTLLVSCSGPSTMVAPELQDTVQDIAPPVDDRVPRTFVQAGHTGNIRSVAFSPDGRYAVSAGDDQTIRLWEVITGKEVRVFAGHAEEVRSVAFSPDGRYLLSGSNDKTIRLWEVTTGRTVRVFRGHTFLVGSVAFSPDGRYAVSGSSTRWLSVARKDKVVRLWDVATGAQIKALKGHKDAVSSVAFSPDGRHVLSGSDDKTIRLWSVATGETVQVFKGHKNVVSCAAFSPDGRYIVSGSDDVRLWDVTTGRTVRVFKGHADHVHSVAFSPDGQHVLSGSGDENIRLWSVATGKTVKFFLGHSEDVLSVAFSPDGQHVLSGSDDKTVRLWDIGTGMEIKAFAGQVIEVHSAAFSPDGRYALSGGMDNNVLLWDVATGRRIRVLEGHKEPIRAVAFSPDGRHVLSCSVDKTIRLWDAETGRTIRVFTDHMNFISSVSFSPDGRYILSGMQDPRLYDVTTGAEIRRFKGHKFSSQAVAFSPDGRYALSGSMDNTVRLWEVATGRKVRVFRGHKSGVESVAFSPDGRYILSGSRDDTIRLWDAETGRTIRVFTGHRNWVRSVSFSPDGKYALSGGGDGTVRLWDTTTGALVKLFAGHEGSVYSVAFSPDGKYALSAGNDGAVRLWDAKSGQEMAGFFHLEDGEWVVIAHGGYFNSSANGSRHVNVRVANKVYSMDSFTRRFYRPEMVELTLGGKPVPEVETISAVAERPAPSVEILSPADNFVTPEETAEVKVKLTDMGGGIGDLFVYVNGSLVATAARAIRVEPQGSSRVTTLKVALSQGDNRIRVVAYNAENSMSSNPQTILITSDHTFGAPTLYACIAGIDTYDNDDLNLRYAVADARLFAKTVKQLSAPLFKAIKTVLLTSPRETTREAIARTLDAMAHQVKAGDYFVFYCSSHGYVATLATGDSRYYLIPSNVIFLDPTNLQKDAISQDELVTLLGNIPAQNKIMVLDSCHSGEAGRVLQIAEATARKTYTRALSTATAMELLKMASGSSVFTASQSIEEAIEGYNGHGLFTYTLVEGLKGMADENKDTFITLNELKGYVERNVFVRSKTHFKRKQVPYINIGTLDLSLVKVR